jgi:glycosyltransferase involved in cell wall biosynthesis
MQQPPSNYEATGTPSELQLPAPMVASLQPAPEARLWKRLLWVRDRARGAQHAWVVGRGASLAAILLAREAMRVTALDADAEAMAEARQTLDAESEMASEATIAFHVLDAIDSDVAPDATGCDTAIILDGYGESLARWLEPIGRSPVIVRVIVSVAFGIDPAGGREIVFPRMVVDGLPDFQLDHMEVIDGHIEAVLSRSQAGVAASKTHNDCMLRLTELGAAQYIAEMSKRIPELEFELDATHSSWKKAGRLARDLEESTSFQFGQALVLAVRSPGALLRLPLTLGRVLWGRKKQVAAVSLAPRERHGLTEWEKEALRNQVRQVIRQGPDAIKRVVETFLGDASTPLRAFGYLVAAQACSQHNERELEFELASYGLQLDRSVGMLRGFMHVALRARRMQAASETLHELLEHAAQGNKLAHAFLRQFEQTTSYKLAILEEISPRPAQWRRVDGGRLVYVLHNSLPYSSGGYATRSQGLAAGLHALGQPVVCLTRPGFPLDMKPELAPIDVPVVDVIDGVPYQRVLLPSRKDISEYDYVVRSAAALEAELRRLRPAYVQAASNYITGLPALIAARRLGVPFFYEVRGLWEITRMSRDQTFADSISFELQRHLESTLAREADHVFTLTEPMREELIARGVEPSRITLLPNSVDAERFHSRTRDEALARQLGIPDGVAVIGYVGTFVVYEGLEDLVAAGVELHRRGLDFRLLLVGNENASGQDRGPITEEILRVAREGGIESKLIMPGRIPHEQVEAYYSLIDVCPFPRKPWPVCEMVSPMKPLEALAMKKAVIVSSVRALTEMIADDVTGVVFEKGSVVGLADAIAALVSDPDRRLRLGEAGREWVANERSWTQVAERIQAVTAQFDAITVDPAAMSVEAAADA